MKEIEYRSDVAILVTTFYHAVRQDALLGPIFNRQLSEEQWPDHLEKLTDFWVTALFGVACFKGNPMRAHRQVDKSLHHTIHQFHFETWLHLWFQAIDSLYIGELAEQAKDAAKRMATNQYTAIRKQRP